MRQSRTGQDVTFEADDNLSTLQFTAVKYVAGPAGGVDARVDAAASGERAHGILQNKPLEGKGAVVRVNGFSHLVVDGSGDAIVAGAALKVGSGGVGVLADTDKDHVFATACAASDAAGDIIEVAITPYDLAV